MLICLVLTLLLLPSQYYCLDNGLALTPPMGFLTWERFRCLTDCELYPEDCISEKNFKIMADHMVQDGYLEAGYEYIIIDDCWLARERDENGRLQPDADRFPSGIKALSDYTHSLGLKFGIYEDYGDRTCAGYPGIVGHLEIDAQTFGEWEVDYIKIDRCNHPDNMEDGFIEFGRYLNQTGRPIVYSCLWPIDHETSGQEANYELLTEHCNLWRNYIDIEDSWSSVVTITNWFSKVQDRIAPYHGPGHWHDPDMLLTGNFGLSFDQAKAQMAIWSVFGAPLLMSVDLRTIEPKFKDILLNPIAIAINQDEMGIQGKLVLSVDNIHVWMKPIRPIFSEKFSYGLAFVSFRDDGYPFYINVKLSDLGMDNPFGYSIESVFGDAVEEFVPADGSFSFKVNPSGVIFLRATPLTSAARI